MRHLRWVNEALDLLGQSPSLGRAESIDRQFNRPFELKPLTSEQLQWFIDVEKPSQIIGGTIDGMYVRLFASIDRQPELFPERERLVHLIKLIIDEGEEHDQRFLSIQEHLKKLEILPDEYLRTLQDAQPGSQEATLQELSDRNYEVLLGSLAVPLSLGDEAGGLLLEQSRRAMFNFHETGHHLAGKGIRTSFNLLQEPAFPFTATTAHVHVDSLALSMRNTLEAVESTGADPEKELARRQKVINEELFSLMHQLIEEDLAK